MDRTNDSQAADFIKERDSSFGKAIDNDNLVNTVSERQLIYYDSVHTSKATLNRDGEEWHGLYNRSTYKP